MIQLYITIGNAKNALNKSCVWNLKFCAEAMGRVEGLTRVCSQKLTAWTCLPYSITGEYKVYFISVSN